MSAARADHSQGREGVGLNKEVSREGAWNILKPFCGAMDSSKGLVTFRSEMQRLHS